MARMEPHKVSKSGADWQASLRSPPRAAAPGGQPPSAAASPGGGRKGAARSARGAPPPGPPELGAGGGGAGSGEGTAPRVSSFDDIFVDLDVGPPGAAGAPSAGPPGAAGAAGALSAGPPGGEPASGAVLEVERLLEDARRQFQEFGISVPSASWRPLDAAGAAAADGAGALFQVTQGSPAAAPASPARATPKKAKSPKRRSPRRADGLLAAPQPPPQPQPQPQSPPGGRASPIRARPSASPRGPRASPRGLRPTPKPGASPGRQGAPLRSSATLRLGLAGIKPRGGGGGGGGGADDLDDMVSTASGYSGLQSLLAAVGHAEPSALRSSRASSMSSGANGRGSAQIRDLCAADKAKVARLIRKLAGVTAERDGFRREAAAARDAAVREERRKFAPRLERIKEQNRQLAEEVQRSKGKFSHAMSLLQKYQTQVKELARQSEQNLEYQALIKSLKDRRDEQEKALQAARELSSSLEDQLAAARRTPPPSISSEAAEEMRSAVGALKARCSDLVEENARLTAALARGQGAGAALSALRAQHAALAAEHSALREREQRASAMEAVLLEVQRLREEIGAIKGPKEAARPPLDAPAAARSPLRRAKERRSPARRLHRESTRASRERGVAAGRQRSEMAYRRAASEVEAMPRRAAARPSAPPPIVAAEDFYDNNLLALVDLIETDGASAEAFALPDFGVGDLEGAAEADRDLGLVALEEEDEDAVRYGDVFEGRRPWR